MRFSTFGRKFKSALHSEKKNDYWLYKGELTYRKICTEEYASFDEKQDRTPLIRGFFPAKYDEQGNSVMFPAQTTPNKEKK